MKDRDTQLEAAYRGTQQGLDQALELIETLQRDLDSMRQELAWSHRLSTLGTLAATLAHEYNNLLTPVGIYAQLALADPDDPEKTRRALEAAVKGVEQASRLAEATLGFAGPSGQGGQGGEAGQRGVGSSSLASVAEQALACVGPRLRQSRVELEIKLEDTELAIEPLALQQVLINLLSNAEKAMRTTGGRRAIQLGSKRRGDQAVIVVQDTGPGVPAEIRGRLFEPFVTHRALNTSVFGSPSGSGGDADDQRLKQRDTNTHRRTTGNHCETTGPQAGTSHGGTGLGLSICKRLVESAGGMIRLAGDAASQSGLSPGRGACFEVTLPIASNTT